LPNTCVWAIDIENNKWNKSSQASTKEYNTGFKCSFCSNTKGGEQAKQLQLNNCSCKEHRNEYYTVV
jgi:hypothetical protein